jgi:hypothetical protein
LIDRRDLVAALDRAAEKKVTVISAPAGSGKTTLLRLWASRPGQDRRIALMSVRPGQHDAQMFWLTLLAFPMTNWPGCRSLWSRGWRRSMRGRCWMRARATRNG